MTWLFIYTTVQFVNKPLKRFIGISETQETCLNCFKNVYLDKVLDGLTFTSKVKTDEDIKEEKKEIRIRENIVLQKKELEETKHLLEEDRKKFE